MKGWWAVGVLVGLALVLGGCVGARGIERHEVRMTVVYADWETIHEEATRRGYDRPGWVLGFYDQETNELFCPLGYEMKALRVCGHELKPVTNGRFH